MRRIETSGNGNVDCRSRRSYRFRCRSVAATPGSVDQAGHRALAVFQPEADGHGGRLDPPAHAQLRQDVADVDAHGLLADEQAVADLAVGPAAGDEGQDLELALRQP